MRRRSGNTGPPDWKELLAIAKLADPDPWRNGPRDALQARDRKALEALEATAEVASLSPATLHLLGYALSDVGAADRAVSLLRRDNGSIRETCGSTTLRLALLQHSAAPPV